MAGREAGSLIIDGIAYCPCTVDLPDHDQAFLRAVAKLVPEGEWFDAHSYNYGRTLAVLASSGIGLNERRACVKVEWPIDDPTSIASALSAMLNRNDVQRGVTNGR